MKIKTFLVGLVATLAMASAQASLLDGQTVNYQYLFPDAGTNYNANAANGNYVVGVGVEVSNVCCNIGTLDISDGNLFVNFGGSSTFTSSSFNGFRITDVFGTIGDFTSVTINGLTNMAGFNASRVTFDANNIWVNWQGLSFNGNTNVSIDIGGTTSVPEPASLALVGLGLIGLAFSRRRKQR